MRRLRATTPYRAGRRRTIDDCSEGALRASRRSASSRLTECARGGPLASARCTTRARRTAGSRTGSHERRQGPGSRSSCARRACGGPSSAADAGADAGAGLDASIGLDAGEAPDAGRDAGHDARAIPSAEYVGAPCRTDADCRGPVDRCLLAIDDDLPAPNGYCTTRCFRNADCPGQSDCNTIYGFCLASCGDTVECPPGLGCQPFLANLPDLPRNCFPGCEDDFDCDDGLSCVVGGGKNNTGLCIDRSRPLGGACQSDEDCPPEATCSEYEPGGYCLLDYCMLEPEDGCPDDARCVKDGLCYDGCTTDADCRAGYECGETSTDPGRLVCLEAFVPANLGQPCSDGCPGGACMDERYDGFPGSYCAAVGCDVIAQTGCPGDGVCIERLKPHLIEYRTATYCLDGCTTAADCRSGYDCLPSRTGDDTSPLACMPACETDADCTACRRRWARTSAMWASAHVAHPSILRGSVTRARPSTPARAGSASRSN